MANSPLIRPYLLGGSFGGGTVELAFLAFVFSFPSFAFWFFLTSIVRHIAMSLFSLLRFFHRRLRQGNKMETDLVWGQSIKDFSNKVVWIVKLQLLQFADFFQYPSRWGFSSVSFCARYCTQPALLSSSRSASRRPTDLLLGSRRMSVHLEWNDGGKD